MKPAAVDPVWEQTTQETPASAIDKRILLLAGAAVFIAGLCAFKATRVYPPQSKLAARAIREPAPPFELYDSNSPQKLVRLAGYLGRHRLLVVFFDGSLGAHASPVLVRLRDEAKRLHQAGIPIMAVSAALPQENRKDAAAHGGFPFTLLSDPGLEVHRRWGRFDQSTGRPRSGVFLIDRAGNVAWSRADDLPQPLANWEAAMNGLLEGH